MEVGEPQRTIVVEPVEDPVPREEPLPPDEQPERGRPEEVPTR